MSSLPELFAAHEADIRQLRLNLGTLLEPSKHSDLWLLRFLLSNKSIEEAQESITFTIAWFKEHQQAIDTVLAGGKCPFEDDILRFQVIGDHKKTSHGEPMFFVRVGLCNNTALMNTVAYEHVLNFMIFSRLRTVVEIERASQETQTLVKAVSVIDLQHFNPARGNDMRFFRVLGESSKLSEKMFPQFLGRSIMVNAPSPLVWAFNSILKPLLSKKTAEKTVFCPGKTSGKSIVACPYLSRYLVLENIPSFLGGTCNCKGGCIGGVPNSQTSPITGVSESGMVSINVAARSVETVEIPLVKGTQIRYEFKVSEKQQIKTSVLFRKTAENDTGEEGKSAIDVVAKRSIEEKDGVISGSFVAPEDGVFVKSFDNSYSWLRSKTVWYKIDYLEE
ncbi:CRAL-TRIO domain-containing protein [Obelidium mucronatum]|nr:CRAL-TRIO domain-containing protein [Obelidium mucronatum]